MPKKKELFNTLKILSYIANIIWTILFTILLIGCVVNGVAQLKETSLDQFFGGLIVLFIPFTIAFILMNICSLYGVFQLNKGKKRGFMIYAISNGAWVLSVIYASGGNLLMLGMAAVSVLFIAYYAIYSKQLK